MKKVFFIVLILLLSNLMTAQTYNDAFDLNFQSVKDGYRWSWLCTALSMEFSLENMNNQVNRSTLVIIPSAKHSKQYGATSSEAKLTQGKTEFVLARTLILPTYKNGDVCEIKLNCKNDIDSLMFMAFSLDREENIVSTDSIFIKSSDNYVDNSIRLTLNKERALRIIIKYSGNTNKDYQKAFRLSGITAQIDRSIINKWPINSVVQTEKTLLNKNSIIPLSFSNISSLSRIRDWDNKKIIGLGEFAHGSQEVKNACSQFIQYLTDSGDCKYLLFEAPMDMCLRWDLYIQGISPEEYKNDLINELRSFFGNYQTTIDLLTYLRKYNETALKKIHVFGIDNLEDNNFIIDYFDKLGDNGYYSVLLIKREFKKLKNELRNKSDWISILGEKVFDYLLYVIDEQERKYSMSNTVFFNQRENNMFMHVEKLTDLYPDPSEKIVIYAHSSHINKYCYFFDNCIKPPLGMRLFEKYQDLYFTIAFQAGNGFYTQDSTVIIGNTMTDKLPIAPVYSFENSALRTGFSYFYYPTNYIPEDLCALRVVPRESRFKDNFYYCCIPKHFDALVFIKNSHELESIERYPDYYFLNYKNKLSVKVVKRLNAYLSKNK